MWEKWTGEAEGWTRGKGLVDNPRRKKKKKKRGISKGQDTLSKLFRENDHEGGRLRMHSEEGEL